jgi:lipopolysaccharide export system protein LptA
MRPSAARHARLALLAGALAFGALLYVSYGPSNRAALPGVAPGSSPTPGVSAGPSPSPGASTAPATENLVWRRMREGDEVFLLRARRMLGQEQEEVRLEGVDLTFQYKAQGKPDKGRVTADQGLYLPGVQKAQFQGHAHLVTGDGLELRSETMLYRGDKQIARTDKPVEFHRKDVTGTSIGAVWDAEKGTLELLENVVMRIQDEDNPPTDIQADAAQANRADGTMKFTGNVVMTQGRDRLAAEKLTVNFGDDREIYRAQASGKVELVTTGDSAVPGLVGPQAGKGARHLTCDKLDLFFRAGRTLQEATARPDAVMVLMPGPGEPPERRRLQAQVLAFSFDEQHRLQELRGTKGATFTTESLPPAKPGPPRTVTCRSFTAHMLPSGELDVVEYDNDIVFRQGKQRATADKAYFEGPSGMLYLKQQPELLDETDGSKLVAEAIDLDTRTSDVAARFNVRHVLSQGAAAGGLFAGRADPVQVSGRFFDYVARTRTAHYREEVVLRSGKDEVRAPDIVLEEPVPGRHRLLATGGVSSRLRPSREGDALVEGRGTTMTYDGATGQLVYDGDTFIKQGDLETRSPKATLVLSKDGSGLEKMVAGEPVEVKQAARTAKGREATFLPAKEEMTLQGDPATLQDGARRVQGRTLTFHLHDDRLLVDGQEQERTETVFKKDAK